MESLSQQNQDIQSDTSSLKPFQQERSCTQLIVFQKISYSLQFILLLGQIGVITMRLQSLELQFSMHQAIQTSLMIFIALFVLCDQLKFKFIDKYFLFMKTFRGKALFYILAGGLMISKSADGFIWQRVLGICMLLFVGVLLFFSMMTIQEQINQNQGIYKKGSDYQNDQEKCEETQKLLQ